SFSAKELEYAQQHLLILSGLYGYLRPLDLIQAYRLEMKTKLANPHGNDLYQFWGDKISKGLNKALKKIGSDTVINLASTEYFSAIDMDALDANMITVHFRELKNGQYKVIGINAKRARGAMTRYMMQKRVKDIAALKKFNDLDYKFSAKLSDKNNIVFIR
nr:peroxide stress protein YaaA [Gammaproteobacteria bacterium]